MSVMQALLMNGGSVSIDFQESVDFASTSTTIFGPTVPNYVDNTYFGVLMEYTSSYNSLSALPSGWTQFFLEPSSPTGAVLSVCYKIFNTSDRGTTPGRLYGGSQRDQLFIFRKNNGSISTITQGGSTSSQATGALSVGAPSTPSNRAAVSIHYFYNDTTATPTVTSSPSMTLRRSTVNSYHGGQYLVYNSGQTPQNQSTNATLAGTIRQGLFWLTVS